MLVNTVRVKPEEGDTCGLYCVHFVKYRYRNFTLEDIVNEISARDPKTIEAELKDIYELILCTTTIYIVKKKNWIRIFVIVDALNHSSLSSSLIPLMQSPQIVITGLCCYATLSIIIFRDANLLNKIITALCCYTTLIIFISRGIPTF
jgi:hypothetical protein